MGILGLHTSDLIPGGPVVVDAGKLNDSLSADTTVRLSKLIADAGFTGSDAIIMRAIVLSESNGNKNAVGHNTNGTIDVGLAQMNSVHKPAGETLAAWTARMKDPVQNLKEAKGLHDSRGGFGDWVTYNTGRYRINMPRPRDPQITLSKNSLTGAVGDAATSVVNTVTSPFESLANLVTVLFQADTWARIGKGALGGVFVVLGTGAMVFVIANKTGVASTAKKAVM